MTDRLSVLVVDDQILRRQCLSEIVDHTELGKTIHVSSDGELALEWLDGNSADIVVLASVIRDKSAVAVLQEFHSRFPGTAVIMASDRTEMGVKATVAALEQGALDFIFAFDAKGESSDISPNVQQLNLLFAQIKINRYATDLGHSEPQREVCRPSESKANPYSELPKVTPQKPAAFEGSKTFRPNLIVIAASTGGPAALEVVVNQIPAGLPIPILIVQHMPPDFTGVLAQALDKRCGLEVREGREGDSVRQGTILIAPGGLHMRTERISGTEVVVRLDSSPYVNGVRPAADVLLDSVIGAYEGRSVLVVVLTGMGSDGLRGILELKQRGHCYCLSQSEKSCVVYGMPRCVFEAGAADEVVDLKEIGSRMCQIAAGKGW